MSKNQTRSGRVTRIKMMSSAVKLFLENGYHATKTEEISRLAGMSRAGYFNVFRDKEAVLYALVEQMFNYQFKEAAKYIKDSDDGLLLYAFESSIQLAIAELNDALHDLYVAAYSLPATSDLIFRITAEKLVTLFKDYLPNYKAKDFYELELATGGITRSFIAKKSGIYFTFEHKLTRYLNVTLKIYDIPEQKRKEVIDATLRLPLNEIAKNIIEHIKTVAEEALFEKEQKK